LEAQLRAALSRIEELEALLRRYSGNSSRPPSSDPPSAPPRPKKEPTGRKRGGQVGHEKHKRVMLPPHRVRSVSECLPEECRGCGDVLDGIDPDPQVHQVFDIPHLIACADEFRLHSLYCSRCGITTQGQLPAGVPTTGISPRFEALIGMLSGKYRLPKRSVQEMCSDVFDVDIALGSVCNAEQRVSEAIADPFAEAHEAVKAAPVVNADETGWREAKQKAWLWVATTATIAVFLIRRRRNTDVAKELLGAFFPGRLITDRWVAYDFVNYLRRQLCWAHLKRDFKSFLDHGAEAKRIGLALEDARKRLFRHWYRARDGTICRSTLRANARPIQREILDLLREGIHCPPKKVAGMCREILDAQHSLFLFIAQEGVEPTNNHAEQTIRHAVIWRKISFGTDSEVGSRFVERMLTVVQTLRLQKRCVLDYLTSACEARLHGASAPSLIASQQA
jgi:transposase